MAHQQKKIIEPQKEEKSQKYISCMGGTTPNKSIIIILCKLVCLTANIKFAKCYYYKFVGFGTVRCRISILPFFATLQLNQLIGRVFDMHAHTL